MEQKQAKLYIDEEKEHLSVTSNRVGMLQRTTFLTTPP